ncbi:ABC-2 family transporter protein [Actinopolymorpha alba]|uniref:ABC-2 family transporter protein n=1 Tax=Actinopolymorpha alba TaxID=533267 RepID=UPI0012F6FF52|nr:ABC-2 family transporter protein [Actinopolymorpha alba]
MLRLVGLSIWRQSLSQWSWRSFLITIVIGQSVTPLLGLLVWSAALPGDSQVSTYYVALLAVQLMTASYEHHTLSNGIYDGTLARALVQPQPVVIDVIGSNLGLRIWHLIFGLPLIAIAAVVAGAQIDVYEGMLALPAVVIAGALRFVFTYLLALSALWTERAHGVVGLGETLIFLLGGTAAPLGYLPEPFRSVGQALPFWSMLGLPAEIAAGTIHGAALSQAYAVQLGWLVVLTALAAVIWRVGLRRFAAVGA